MKSLNDSHNFRDDMLLMRHRFSNKVSNSVHGRTSAKVSYWTEVHVNNRVAHQVLSQIDDVLEAL